MHRFSSRIPNFLLLAKFSILIDQVTSLCLLWCFVTSSSKLVAKRLNKLIYHWGEASLPIPVYKCVHNPLQTAVRGKVKTSQYRCLIPESSKNEKTPLFFFKCWINGDVLTFCWHKIIQEMTLNLLRMSAYSHPVSVFKPSVTLSWCILLR